MYVVTWASWRLKTVATRLLVHQLVGANDKENIQLWQYRPFVCHGNPPVTDGFSSQKGQWCGRRFHAMRSPYARKTYDLVTNKTQFLTLMCSCCHVLRPTNLVNSLPPSDFKGRQRYWLTMAHYLSHCWSISLSPFEVARGHYLSQCWLEIRLTYLAVQFHRKYAKFII